MCRNAVEKMFYIKIKLWILVKLFEYVWSSRYKGNDSRSAMDWSVLKIIQSLVRRAWAGVCIRLMTANQKIMKIRLNAETEKDYFLNWTAVALVCAKNMIFS